MDLDWCQDCGYNYINNLDREQHNCKEKIEREAITKLGEEELRKWSEAKYKEQLDKLRKWLR